jgi:hypothetical protein
VRSSARLRISVFLSCAVLSGGAAAFGASVAVVASSAPLMDAASSEAQVLGRVSQGAHLVPTGRKSGDWIEVQAPSEVSGWVYGELVREGVIAASSVKVRSGPGIGYASLGTLTKGAPVVRRGSRGDWFEIEGQPPLMVWVERAMVAERASAELADATRNVPPPPVAAVAPVQQAVAALPEQGNAVPPAPSAVPRVAVAPQQAAAPLPAVQSTNAPPVTGPVIKPPAVAPLAVVSTPYASQAAVARPASAPVVPPVRSFSSAPAPVVVGKAKPPSGVPSVPVPSRSEVRRVRSFSSAPAPVRSSGTAARPVKAVPHRQGESPVQVTSTAGLRLIASAPQGESITVSGMLRPAGLSLTSGADYRLVSAGGQGPSRTLCYVTGDQAAFEERVGRAVTVEGRKYWVYGSREPVVLVRSIR